MEMYNISTGDKFICSCYSIKKAPVITDAFTIYFKIPGYFTGL